MAVIWFVAKFLTQLHFNAKKFQRFRIGALCMCSSYAIGWFILMVEFEVLTESFNLPFGGTVLREFLQNLFMDHLKNTTETDN